MEVRKCQKMAELKVCLLHRRVSRRLTVNYDTARHFLNFLLSRQIFIFILIRCHVAFTPKVFHLWHTNFAFYEELTVSPMGRLFFIPLFCISQLLTGLLTYLVFVVYNTWRRSEQPVIGWMCCDGVNVLLCCALTVLVTMVC